MGAITDLLKSERGILAVLLIIAATVLAALGHMTEGSWREYTLYIFSVYAGVKTVTGAVQLWKGQEAEADPATTTTPAPATAAASGS